MFSVTALSVLGDGNYLIIGAARMTQAMIPSIPFSCQCGMLSGEVNNVSRKSAVRLVCCCSSCQAYARHLDKLEWVLDAHGGTEVIMMSQAAMQIHQGKEQLAALKMTQKGPVRIYAGCCNTPVANIVANRHIPFMSLITCGLGEHSDASEPLRKNRDVLDRHLGPVSAVLYADLSKTAPPTASDWWSRTKAISKLVSKTAQWAIKGETKHSVFWDHGSGELIFKPKTIAR